MQITLQKTNNPKEKPDPNSLEFGKSFTDHMFIMDYEEGRGWYDARIAPYAPIEMYPSIMVCHYGQAAFEGLKAYRSSDGGVLFFRIDENAKRLNFSSERLCMPMIDEKDFIEAVKTLVAVDKDWVPSAQGTSLYIRPFIFATDAYIGVKPSATYKFIVLLSPVGSYYKEGLNPISIYVEDEYVRAVKGGMGETKAAANYASSLKAQYEAEKKGISQVLWLDGIHRKYIEEVGTMNVFFVIGDEVVTPMLNGSILSGITRKSALQLLKDWGIQVRERQIAIDELVEAYQKGALKEVFGTGTAAVISPVGSLVYKGENLIINNNQIGEISKKLYDNIVNIQTGKAKDEYNWTTKL